MLCRFLPCAYQCICVHYSALGVHFASAPPKYHASTRLFVAFLCVAYPCMLILCCIFIEFPWAAFLCISLVAFVSMRCYFVLRRIRQHSHPVYTTCIWTHMHCISHDRCILVWCIYTCDDLLSHTVCILHALVLVCIRVHAPMAAFWSITVHSLCMATNNGCVRMQRNALYAARMNHTQNVFKMRQNWGVMQQNASEFTQDSARGAT